ncbi:MAG: hypothetical protein J6Y23_13180, partial [Prevotella sp.]|nr:hypothetical protein [Prevotella sp.]
NAIYPHEPAPYATNDRCFPIYLDASTDGYTISDNSVIGKGLVTKEQIGFNNPGPAIRINVPKP